MIDEDRELLLKVLVEKYKGKMPYTANSSSEEIYNEFSMSRKAFKRALGNLYKEEVVYFDEDTSYEAEDVIIKQPILTKEEGLGCATR